MDIEKPLKDPCGLYTLSFDILVKDGFQMPRNPTRWKYLNGSIVLGRWRFTRKRPPVYRRLCDRMRPIRKPAGTQHVRYREYVFSSGRDHCVSIQQVLHAHTGRLTPLLYFFKVIRVLRVFENFIRSENGREPVVYDGVGKFPFTSTIQWGGRNVCTYRRQSPYV